MSMMYKDVVINIELFKCSVTIGLLEFSTITSAKKYIDRIGGFENDNPIEIITLLYLLWWQPCGQRITDFSTSKNL